MKIQVEKEKGAREERTDSVEEEIENGRVIDGLDLVASPVVSGAFSDGSLGFNGGRGGRRR